MIIVAVILLAAGAICLAIPSLTFITQKGVADTGYFQINVWKPHTIVMNPIAGVMMKTAGVILFLLAL